MLESKRKSLFFNPFLSPLPKHMQENLTFMMGFSPFAPLFGVPWTFSKFFEASQQTKTIPSTEVVESRKVIAHPLPDSKQHRHVSSVRLIEDTPQDNEKSEVATPSTTSKIPSEKPNGSESVNVFDFKKNRTVISSSLDPVSPLPEGSKKRQATTTASKHRSGKDIDKGKPNNLLSAKPKSPDDLKLMKGVGPKLEGLLNKLGIYKFEQFINYVPEELQWIDNNLSAFKGRALRDDWVKQARDLIGEAD